MSGLLDKCPSGDPPHLYSGTPSRGSQREEASRFLQVSPPALLDGGPTSPSAPSTVQLTLSSFFFVPDPCCLFPILGH